jgi:hypothetical protein
MYRLPIEENPEHLCLNCGKKLAQVIRGPSSADWASRPTASRIDSGADHETREAQYREDEKAFRRWRREHSTPTGTYGKDGNNAFCTGPCAMSFALLAARAGYRLRRRAPAETASV